jgi:hypothetical protein
MRDTPIRLKSVCLEIQVHRFRCHNEQCEQKTFAEQYPQLVGRRRRHTHRLMANLAHIGLATGGEAGVNLANKLAMYQPGNNDQIGAATGYTSDSNTAYYRHRRLGVS